MSPRRQHLVDRPLPNDISAAVPARRGARAARSVRVNLNESPLGWLKSRGLLTARQFDAGEQLRIDYERAALGARITMAWDAAPVSRSARGAPDAGAATLSQLSAKARFDAALADVGTGLRDILWRVVCAGEGVPEAERALNWPVRSGRLVLGLALDRLADHYRML